MDSSALRKVWTSLDALSTSNPEAYKRFIADSMKEMTTTVRRETAQLVARSYALQCSQPLLGTPVIVNVCCSNVVRESQENDQVALLAGPARNKSGGITGAKGLDSERSQATVLDVVCHPSVSTRRLATNNKTVHSQIDTVVVQCASEALGIDLALEKVFAGGTYVGGEDIHPGTVAMLKKRQDQMKTTDTVAPSAAAALDIDKVLKGMRDGMKREEKEEEEEEEEGKVVGKEESELIEATATSFVARVQEYAGTADTLIETQSNERITRAPLIEPLDGEQIKSTPAFESKTMEEGRRVCVRIRVDGCASIRDCDVRVLKDCLTCDVVGVYAPLRVTFPEGFSADEESARAKFVRKTQTLVVDVWRK